MWGGGVGVVLSKWCGWASHLLLRHAHYTNILRTILHLLLTLLYYDTNILPLDLHLRHTQGFVLLLLEEHLAHLGLHRADARRPMRHRHGRHRPRLDHAARVPEHLLVSSGQDWFQTFRVPAWCRGAMLRQFGWLFFSCWW